MIRKLTALLICMLLTLLIPQSAFAVPVPGSSDRQFTYREDNIEGNHYDFVNSVNRSFFRKAWIKSCIVLCNFFLFLGIGETTFTGVII